MKARFILFLGALFCASLLATGAVAQSTDPSSPTPLTSEEITGGEVAERASYYFTFEGGPGEVTAALSAKMKKGEKGGSVGVEIFDANARSIAGTVISGGLDAGRERLEQELFKQLGKLTSAADSLGGGTKQKTARVKVKQRQPLVLRLTVDQGVESFTLRVGGAVEFAPTDGGATPADATGDTGAMSAEEAAPAEQATPADQTTPAEQTTPTPEADTPTGDAEPTGGKPAVKIIPGKRSALVKIDAKQAQPPQTTPPVVQQQPQARKHSVIVITKKKPQP